MAEAQDTREGLLLGAGAFTLWGLYPFYFKALSHVPVLEIIAHRILWSTLLLAAIIQLRRGWAPVHGALLDRRLRRGLTITTLLIAANWLVYVLAVTGGQVLDASLGYFLCPIVSVALGVIVLKERLTPWQLAAVGLATLAVGLLIVELGIVPKLALFLAVSFGLYGLCRKQLPVDPLTALFLECALLLPLAVVVAIWLAATGGLRGGVGEGTTLFLLSLSGIVTVGPLLLYGMGGKRLRLSTVGLLQYIAPTLLFIEGVVWFGEPLSRWQLVAFGMIWAALVVYTLDGMLRARQPA